MKIPTSIIFLITLLLSSVAYGRDYIDCTKRLPKNLNELCISQELGSNHPDNTGLILNYGLSMYAHPLLANSHASQDLSKDKFKKQINLHMKKTPREGLSNNEYAVKVFYLSNNEFSDLNRTFFGNDFQHLHVDLLNYPIHPRINTKHYARNEAYRTYIFLASLKTYLDYHHDKETVRINVDKVRTMMRTAMKTDLKKNDKKIDEEMNCMLRADFFNNPTQTFHRYLKKHDMINLTLYSKNMMKKINMARQCRV